jgi:hypothetical protein
MIVWASSIRDGVEGGGTIGNATAALAIVVKAIANAASAWIGLIREVVVSLRRLVMRVQCRRSNQVPAE